MTSIRASCGLIGNEDVPFKYSKNLDVSNGTSSLLIDVYRFDVFTVKATAISYNWLFQWDYTFYKWGYN